MSVSKQCILLQVTLLKSTFQKYFTVTEEQVSYLSLQQFVKCFSLKSTDLMYVSFVQDTYCNRWSFLRHILNFLS